MQLSLFDREAGGYTAVEVALSQRRAREQAALAPGFDTLALFASFTHRVIDSAVAPEYLVDRLDYEQATYGLRVLLRDRGAGESSYSPAPELARRVTPATLVVERAHEVVWTSGDLHRGHVSIVRLGAARQWVAVELRHDSSGSRTSLVWLPTEQAFEAYEWEIRAAHDRALPAGHRPMAFLLPAPGPVAVSTIFGRIEPARVRH